MTVHMFRVYAHNPEAYSKALIDQWITDWIDGHDRWENDTVTHSLSVANTEIDGSGTEYLRGDFRFHQTDDADSIRGSFDALFRAIMNWWRIGYHACEHDEENVSPCSWDAEYNEGTVPSDIPKIDA